MIDVERAAKAYYDKITELAAKRVPGGPFKSWADLPEEQREMNREAIKAAFAVPEQEGASQTLPEPRRGDTHTPDSHPRRSAGGSAGS